MQLDNVSLWTMHSLQPSAWVCVVGGVNMLSWLAVMAGMVTGGKDGGAVTVSRNRSNARQPT